MNLNETLYELFGKNRDEIGTVELSSTDKVRTMGDHIDFIYNGKSIIRIFNEDNMVFTSVGLSDRKMRDRINACFYAMETPYSVYMKDGKVFFSYGGRLLRNSVELDLCSMYKLGFENNQHTFERF